jgi:hypothetical protein
MKMVMGSKEKNTPMNFSEKAMKYMKAMPALYGKPKMDHGKPKMMKGGPGDGKRMITDKKPVKNKKIDPKTPITDFPSVKTKSPMTDKKLGDFMNKNTNSDLDMLYKKINSAPNKPPKGARIKQMTGVYPIMMYKNKKK